VFPLRPFSYRATDPARSVRPPDRTHWLGTDKEGRDVFARMVYGTRISLAVGVVAVSLYVAIGVVLGALAGWFGGRVDLVISRAIEVMICLPTFFLILALVALVQERSIFHVMAIIGVTSWTGVARLVRAEFLRQRDLDYVQAAVALGVSTRRILFVHMLPNALGPVLVSATFGVASAILVESSLAFLGLGDVSVASWGETLNAGRLEGKAWLVLVPGFAIFFVVSAFNLVGEGLRDALDPKLRS
jgi:peptide/nickel transport system permease protein